MRAPPLIAGAGAGLLLALLLAPATGTALGTLATARAERAKAAVAAAAPEAPAAALVAPGLASGSPGALEARIRQKAREGGVLVEQFGASSSGALILARVRLSGAEKAVVALADALERGTPLMRLRSWRLEPVAGGVRLSAEIVAVHG
jgi:hypothetical protein